MKATKTADSIRAVGDRTGTWDLPLHHYMEWYPVASETAQDRLLAHAAARAVTMRIWREPNLKELGFLGMAEELTTLAQLSALWKVSRATVRRRLAEAGIRAICLGSKRNSSVRFLKRDIDEFLRRSQA